MKVIILAGGFGTRLSEYTSTIPKPMVPIGGLPILWHIMRTFAHYGHNDFYLALGYKSHLIKEYFLNYHYLNSDFSVDLATGKLTSHKVQDIDWRITLVDTGIDTMTGGRVKRLQDHIGNEPFLLTYGDGVADINIKDLISFHKSTGKMVTVTAVRPVARFGELSIVSDQVVKFKEKPQLGEGWVNGGYFVIKPEFFSHISDDSSILERKPLENIALMGELAAYQHNSFWQCLDTKRDLETLEELWNNGEAPWKV